MLLPQFQRGRDDQQSELRTIAAPERRMGHLMSRQLARAVELRFPVE